MSDEREIGKRLRALESAAFTAVIAGATEEQVVGAYDSGVREALQSIEKQAQVKQQMQEALAMMGRNAA